MTTRADLYPLFDPSLSLSADQARAIVGALQDIAESDGLHAEEQALIAELVADYNLDLGDQAVRLRRSKEQVDFRQCVAQLLLVSLHHAPNRGDHLARSVCLQASRLNDRFD